MIPPIKNIFPNLCWLFCCLLFAFASCTNNEAQISQPDAVASKDVKNYAIINGDSIYVSDFEYFIIEDELNIFVLDEYHAISHDGKYGYVIENAGDLDPKESLTIILKDIQTEDVVKSARLKDIIAKSKFSEALNEVNTYIDTDGQYREDLASAGKYYFDYHESCFGNVFPYSNGLVITACWTYAINLNWFSNYMSYKGAILLFISHDLELEKVIIHNPELGGNHVISFFIDDHDSTYFISNAWVISVYSKNTASFKEIFPPMLLFDFSTFEFLEQYGHTQTTGDTIVKIEEVYSILHMYEPTAIIDRKSLYVFTTYRKRQPIIKVYSPMNKRVALFHSTSLNILLDNLRSNNFNRFCIQGLSNDFIFVTDCDYSSLTNFELKKPPIYAIPRKILDYAD